MRRRWTPQWWKVTLDRAYTNYNANNARLNNTFSCDLYDIECQTSEELEAHKNSHLVKVGPEEANSCQLFNVQEAVQVY